MSIIGLTDGEQYTIGKIAGNPVILSGTDDKHAEKIIRNNVEIEATSIGSAAGSLYVNSNHSSITHPVAKFSNLSYDGSTLEGDDCTIRMVAFGSNWTFGIDSSDSNTFKIHDTNSNFTDGAGNFRITTGGDVYIASDLHVGDDLYVDTNASFGYGTGGNSYRYEFKADNANYMMRLWNDGNNDNREGMRIQCGLDSNPGTSMAFITFADGDGNGLAYITGLGNGDVRFTGQAGSVASDIRNKRDFVPMASSSRGAQSIINDIDIFEYRYKSYDWMTDETKQKVDSEVRIGVSAQAIESGSLAYTVDDFSELNQKDGVKQPEEYGFKFKEVDYREMVPILIQTSKEQFAKIQELEARIKVLETA